MSSGPPTELDNGRYRIERKLGEGGMGEVWAAADTALHRTVAIKLLPESLEEDALLRARFQKEIAVSAAINHPYIVPLHDVGLQGGRLFLVMALVDGPDLGKLLADGPLEPTRAMRLFFNVAAALQAVHDAGYVHRDVKPANILVGKAGSAKEYATLTDFGVARALEDTPGLTKGRPPGTPRYMAPETWKNWEAGPQADQYALACVAFEMFTGRPPYTGSSIGELEVQHCDYRIPELGYYLPEAPNELTESIKRAMEADPLQRFDSIASFASAIAAAEFETPIDEPPNGDGEEVRLQLAPSRVSSALFGIAPDRDERAPQLAMETYLTLWANDYAPPDSTGMRAPKRRNPALRSLVLGTNFLEGLVDPGPRGQSPEQLGAALARGRDFANSANLALAQRALRALVDPQTEQGSAGASLLFPFHESLLWFDARKSGSSGAKWAVRKVNMRGTGITLARMLLDPPSTLGADTVALAGEAVAGIKGALQAPSPFAELADRLQAWVPTEADQSPVPERAETGAWDRASDPALAELGRRIVRHARNVVSDADSSPSTRMLRLRSVLALDVALHILRRSWEASAVPTEQRYLLLTYAPEERRKNRVRIAGEASYLAARQAITQALIATLGRRAAELAERGENFHEQFEGRSRLDEIAAEMADLDPQDTDSFAVLAGRVYEEAKGGGYGRPVDAFRVLLESIALLSGTGTYRWLRAQPELLGAMVSATGYRSMNAPRFLAALHEEWSLVVGEAEAVGTDLEDALDGGVLNRNARHLERLLVASGLAQALSDQTCMVGQRLREAT